MPPAVPWGATLALDALEARFAERHRRRLEAWWAWCARGQAAAVAGDPAGLDDALAAIDPQGDDARRRALLLARLRRWERFEDHPRVARARAEALANPSAGRFRELVRWRWEAALDLGHATPWTLLLECGELDDAAIDEAARALAAGDGGAGAEPPEPVDLDVTALGVLVETGQKGAYPQCVVVDPPGDVRVLLPPGAGARVTRHELGHAWSAASRDPAAPWPYRVAVAPCLEEGVAAWAAGPASPARVRELAGQVALERAAYQDEHVALAAEPSLPLLTHPGRSASYLVGEWIGRRLGGPRERLAGLVRAGARRPWRAELAQLASDVS